MSYVAKSGIILAGGQSLRYSGQGGTPKALATVANLPIVLHVAASLIMGGAGRIIVLTGANHAALCVGLGLQSEGHCAQGHLRVQTHDGLIQSVPFELRFSGNEAGTAGRLLALSAAEIGEASLLSYTDVLSDARLGRLVSVCESGIDLAMLAVRPTLPWGVLELGVDDSITGFTEKPRERSRWVNGGVMAISAAVQKHIYSAEDMLEETVIPRLISSGKLRAVRHEGIWYPMDSPKDFLGINRDVDAGVFTWRRWLSLRLSRVDGAITHV